MSEQTWNSRTTQVSSRTVATARFRVIRLDHIAILALLFAASVAFSHLPSYANQPDQDNDLIPDPRLGMIVHTEIIQLAVPQTLIELARLQSTDHLFRSPNDIKSVLKARGLENLWYVSTLRHDMANGQSTELPCIRHPGYQWEHYREFFDVLDKLNSNRAGSMTDDSVAPTVRIIPDEAVTRDPRAVIAELLK